MRRRSRFLHIVVLAVALSAATRALGTSLGGWSAEAQTNNATSPATDPAKDELNRKLTERLRRIMENQAKGTPISAPGATGLARGTVRPPEFFAYVKVIQTSIKQKWRLDANAEPRVASVEFEIEDDGSIANARIGKSSQDAEFDESVLTAVNEGSPLPPPPAAAREFLRKVRITFDSKEFGGGK